MFAAVAVAVAAVPVAVAAAGLLCIYPFPSFREHHETHTLLIADVKEQHIHLNHRNTACLAACIARISWTTAKSFANPFAYPSRACWQFRQPRACHADGKIK